MLTTRQLGHAGAMLAQLVRLRIGAYRVRRSSVLSPSLQRAARASLRACCATP
jgi:hypothetical protein